LVAAAAEYVYCALLGRFFGVGVDDEVPLDCDLVYALVPRAESMQALIVERARVQARKSVLAVEHSMALEDQAVGRLDEAVETETRRLIRKRAAR